ncbi:MAG: hypothetical protein IJX64_03295, partial [Clostridia bacterium]|nr:hypothetical protein [Clostridia bacterium]
LRRVKYGFAMRNSSAVKYLLRKCYGEFHFTLRRRSNISQLPKEIISHSAQAEYFTIFGLGFETEYAYF